ncbi:helix-turn-helix domain-containing protein [Acinetobacter pittii]|uniref:Helix-turn-helix domain-containing protein n=1 Tax=Acinetobacter pittii TaxID=48296 RepID=A0A6H0G0D4_ACIPI|nr:helix-turn-helix domain-containing protein [Acinetobacter pittii]QIT20012.1 helix-turn-helix domain-containing protein [Acinetobacter pittii]
MGVKNKITGEMADLIVTLRNDQKVNYTFQDIKDQLEKRFNKTISINSIRLCYLKNANKDIKEVVSNSNESIKLEVKKEIKPVLNEVKQVKSLDNNSSSLKTKVATQDQIADLDEQLKNFK